MVNERAILSVITIIKIRMYFILSLLFMFLSNQSNAMVSISRDSSRIQAIIDSARVLNKVHGIQLCIIDSLGKKTSFTSGYRNKKNEPITSSMSLRVGSTAKLFANYLILKSVQDSIISLDDKLSKWYPSFPNSEIITIRNLLMHKSGVVEILGFPKFLMQCSLFPHKVYSTNELIVFLSENGAKRAKQPNLKYEYSNSNYILLGGIAENIYKTEYKYLIDSLAKKLHLPNTSYIQPNNKDLLVNGYDKDLIPFPWGYITKPDNTSWTSLAAAAGGIISNADDLCSFFNFYVNGDELKQFMKSEVFTFESCEHKNTPEIKGIGLGIFQFNVDGVEYWGQEGQMIGSESLVIYCPVSKFIFCITGNRSTFKHKFQIISQINRILSEKGKTSVLSK